MGSKARIAKHILPIMLKHRKEGHTVFISEYNAPDDFVCVWQKEIQSGLNVNSTKKGIEKLFVHKSQAESDYESLY